MQRLTELQKYVENVDKILIEKNQEAYKRDLREAGVTSISLKRQKRDEDRAEKKRLEDLEKRKECKVSTVL